MKLARSLLDKLEFIKRQERLTEKELAEKVLGLTPTSWSRVKRTMEIGPAPLKRVEKKYPYLKDEVDGIFLSTNDKNLSIHDK
jgi:hypothetical protein